MNSDTAFLRASSAAMGFLEMSLLGFASPTGWGRGMEYKINAYRDFVFNSTCDCDIVILVDSSDVIVLGSPEEIRSRFIALERKWRLSLFFAAEPRCTQWGVSICDRLKNRTSGKGPWQFLNSGLLVARAAALRQLLPERLEKPLAHDQEWMREQFLQHPDIVGIDFDTDLMLVPFGIGKVFTGPWSDDAGQPKDSILFEDGAIHNTKTGTKPLLLHFAGPGHWPGFVLKHGTSGLAEMGVSPSDVIRHWIQRDRYSCSLLELFLQRFPEHAQQLHLSKLDHSLPLIKPSWRSFCAGSGRHSPFRVKVDMLEDFNALLFALTASVFTCACITLKPLRFCGRRARLVLSKVHVSAFLSFSDGLPTSTKGL